MDVLTSRSQTFTIDLVVYSLGALLNQVTFSTYYVQNLHRLCPVHRPPRPCGLPHALLDYSTILVCARCCFHSIQIGIVVFLAVSNLWFLPELVLALFPASSHLSHSAPPLVPCTFSFVLIAIYIAK